MTDPDLSRLVGELRVLLVKATPPPRHCWYCGVRASDAALIVAAISALPALLDAAEANPDLRAANLLADEELADAASESATLRARVEELEKALAGWERLAKTMKAKKAGRDAG